MTALLLLVRFTGIILIFTVAFLCFKPDIIISSAAVASLTILFSAVKLHRKQPANDFTAVRKVLHKEVSSIRKPPSRSKLIEFANQTDIQLNEFLGGLETGPTIYRGMKALMEHDYKKASKLFTENTNSQLRRASISLFFAGNALYFQGEYNEAVTAYQKSTDFDPGFAKAWYNWGLTLEALQLLEEAKEKYKKAQELNPRIAETGNDSSQAIKSLAPRQESKRKYRKAPKSNSGFFKCRESYTPVKRESHQSGALQWLILTLQ